MKHLLLPVVLLLLLTEISSAQSPQTIPYQAVARDASGNLISNQAIALRLSVHDGSAGGTVVYQERQTATTNKLGLFNVGVGAGTVLSGTFSTINWASGAKFIQVEFDPAGGTSYTNMGTSQMQSVPYALYAGSSAPSGAASGDLTGTYPAPTLTTSGVTAATYGTTSTYPVITVDNKGRITSATTDPLPTALPPSGAAGGDLTGTYPNPALATAGTAGTYTKVTTDTKGRVTSGTTLAASDIPAGSGNYIQNQTGAQASSNFNISGTGTIPNLYLTNSSTALTQGSGNALRVTNPSGYTEYGSQNGSYSHFITDRPLYYFNRGIQVDGAISSYSTDDLNLQTGGTSRIYAVNSTGAVGIGITAPNAFFHVAGGGAIFGTTGNAAVGRTVSVLANGQAAVNYGAYPGNWTAALQIQNNDNSKFIWMSPLDAGTASNARLMAAGTGFDIYVNGSAGSNGTLSTSFTNGNVAINGTATIGTYGGLTSVPTTYGSLGINITKNGYYGLLFGQATSNPNIMYDGSGNGGIYYENYGWATYYLVGTHHLNVNTAADLGAALGATGGTSHGLYGASSGTTAFGTAGANSNNVTPGSSGGTGVAGAGNNLGFSYLTTGSGGAFHGDRYGAWVRENNFALSTQYAGLVSVDGGNNQVFVNLWNTSNNHYKINGTGTVSTLVHDGQGGMVTLHAPESPEIYFSDYGEGKLINGKAHIEMDPLFARNVVIDAKHPLRVYIQLEGDCNGTFVTNKTATGFDVIELKNGTSNAAFQWNVVCNRADQEEGGRMARYADARFEAGPEHLDSTLKPASEVSAEKK